MDDAATMTPGRAVTINVLANDSDADGDMDARTVRFVDPPRGATLSADGRTLTVPGQGTWTVNLQGQVTFTPAAGFTGTPSEVEYTVADARGNVSDSADISVSVAGGGTGGGLADCFNEAMYRTGSTYAETMRTSQGTTITHNYTVLGTANFNGRTLPQIRAISSDGNVALEYAQISQGFEERYGGSFTLPTGNGDSYTFEPPQRTPLSMAVGQAHSETITQRFANAGTPDPYTRTFRYEGRESITVPAGTFQTCRVNNSFSNSILGNTGSTRAWLIASGPYRGLTVRKITYEANGSVARSEEATALSADWK